MSVIDRISEHAFDPITHGSSRIVGETASGEKVFEHRLINENGLEIRAIDFGAIITGLLTPDRKGEYRNIVLSHSSLDAYERCKDYIGAVVGRFAGRIGGAAYEENGQIVELEKNENGSCLHGGGGGFHKKVWRGRIISHALGASIEFRLRSKHRDGGFPGNLDVVVRYSLTHDDRLCVEYEAESDALTHVNLTQHSYFNLSGREGASIRDHDLQVNARQLLSQDENQIPDGRKTTIYRSQYDFSHGRIIGEAADWIDHDFVLLSEEEPVRRAGVLFHPHSGRKIVVWTDQPSLHVYAGQNLGKSKGDRFLKSAGLCLETQRFPNSPNIRAFPSTRLSPGEVYRHRTVFSFSTDNIGSDR